MNKEVQHDTTSSDCFAALMKATAYDGSGKTVYDTQTFNLLVTGFTMQLNMLTTLNVRQPYTFIATADPADTTNKEVIWGTSDSTIVLIDTHTGKAKALKAGAAIIKAIA